MKLSLLPGLDLRNTFVSILLSSFHVIKSYKHLFEVILVFSFYITFSIRPVFILKLLLRPPNVSSCFIYQLIFIKKKTSTMSYPFQKSSVVSSCTQNKVYTLQPALLTLRNLTFHSYLPLLPGRRYQMYSITSMTFCIFVSEKRPSWLHSSYSYFILIWLSHQIRCLPRSLPGQATSIYGNLSIFISQPLINYLLSDISSADFPLEISRYISPICPFTAP